MAADWTEEFGLATEAEPTYAASATEGMQKNAAARQQQIKWKACLLMGFPNGAFP
jgi:hypothetical protein